MKFKYRSFRYEGVWIEAEKGHKTETKTINCWSLIIIIIYLIDLEENTAKFSSIKTVAWQNTLEEAQTSM